MHACIILHNMIIDDKRDDSFDENNHTATSIIVPLVNYETPASLTITNILHIEAVKLTSRLISHLQSNLSESVSNKFNYINVSFIYSLCISFFTNFIHYPRWSMPAPNRSSQVRANRPMRMPDWVDGIYTPRSSRCAPLTHATQSFSGLLSYFAKTLAIFQFYSVILLHWTQSFWYSELIHLLHYLVILWFC
jgi:hypothetical protein